MFGWNGFKYRNQVIIEVHAILMFVPELKALLKTLPNLRRAAGEFRKLGKSELEAAAYLSVVVLESVIPLMPEHGRTAALQQLLQFEGDRFRWFRDQIANGTGSVEVLPLTFALGHALWYLGFSVDKQELPEAVYETFGRDVVEMLQGKSSGERLKGKIYRTLTA